MTLLNRSGLAAIAAATVFLSTPVLAQETAPVAADPAPIVADTPLPAEPTPAPTPPADVVSDPLAPAEATPTTTRTTRSTRPSRATTAPATRAPATVARTVTAAPVAPTAAAPEAPPAFDPAMVAPLPEPAATTPAPATESMIDNDLLPIAGAAGLGILAIAGAGLAMRRRRREDDVVVEETFHEPVLSRAEPLPIATAPIAAVPLAVPMAVSMTDKSAFNWGNSPSESVRSKSWIEAARRGPTPDNPSLSLKKRLQRAAFFEQRERAVAAGKAVPVSPMAGLPDSQAAAVSSTPPARRLDQGVRMKLGRDFQPA